MTITILRPSTRILTLGHGVRVVQPGGGAAPWWMAAGVTPVVVYQAKGAASYAASKVNLATPGTHDAAEGVAPSWDAGTGWTFNGTTQYLNPGPLNIPNNQTWSGFMRLTLGSGGSGYASPYANYSNYGSGDSAAFGLSTNSSRTAMYFYRNGGSFGTASGSTGVFGIAGPTAYLNGLYKGNITTSGSGAYLQGSVGIGCRLASAAMFPDSYFPGDIVALVLYNVTLTLAQVGLITAALAAL